jgi:hypothetical protein
MRAATNRTVAAIDKYQPRPAPHDNVSFALLHPAALGFPQEPQNDWPGQGTDEGGVGLRSNAYAAGCMNAAAIGEIATRTRAATRHTVAIRARLRGLGRLVNPNPRTAASAPKRTPKPRRSRMSP